MHAARARTGRPSAVLAEHWTTLDDVSQGQRVDLFYRESRATVDTPVMIHLHGFGLSGRYLLPTAVELAGDFHTYVPDLHGGPARGGRRRGRIA